MARPPSFEEIVRADEEIRRLDGVLSKQTGPLAVCFVDMCGSTGLKARSTQREWLPVVCRFLKVVTDAVDAAGGRVVKYIGDEVFAAFEDDDAGLAAARVEHFQLECEAKLSHLGEPYEAKFAFDYGFGVAVQFTRGASDMLATCVDRCARIAKLCGRGMVLASGDFVDRSRRRESWDRRGSFPLRGLAQAIDVYQLRGSKDQLEGSRAELLSLSGPELIEQVAKLEGDLEKAMTEIRRLRVPPH
jgi:class 3 adenylate cyclase